MAASPGRGPRRARARTGGAAIRPGARLVMTRASVQPDVGSFLGTKIARIHAHPAAGSFIRARTRATVHFRRFWTPTNARAPAGPRTTVQRDAWPAVLPGKSMKARGAARRARATANPGI